MPSVFSLVSTTIKCASTVQWNLYVKKENRRSEGLHFCHQINGLQLNVPCLMFCTLTCRSVCAASVKCAALILLDIETKHVSIMMQQTFCGYAAPPVAKTSTGYIFLTCAFTRIVYITIFYFKKRCSIYGTTMFLHECGFLYF